MSRELTFTELGDVVTWLGRLQVVAVVAVEWKYVFVQRCQAGFVWMQVGRGKGEGGRWCLLRCDVVFV